MAAGAAVPPVPPVAGASTTPPSLGLGSSDGDLIPAQAPAASASTKTAHVPRRGHRTWDMLHSLRRAESRPQVVSARLIDGSSGGRRRAISQRPTCYAALVRRVSLAIGLALAAGACSGGGGGGSGGSGGGGGAVGSGGAIGGGGIGGVGSGGSGGSAIGGGGGTGPIVLPRLPARRSLAPGRPNTALPMPLLALDNGGDEGWLGSPAVADLDGDGSNEIIAARDAAVVVWRADGSHARLAAADRQPDLVVAAGRQLRGRRQAGDRRRLPRPAGACSTPRWPRCPASRSPGATRCAASRPATSTATGGSRSSPAPPTISTPTARPTSSTSTARDGSQQPGFPANTTGTLGLRRRLLHPRAASIRTWRSGRSTGMGGDDIFLPQDNAYVSMHDGTGVAFAVEPDLPQPDQGARRPLHARLRRGATGLRRRRGDRPAGALHQHGAGAIADLDGDGETRADHGQLGPERRPDRSRARRRAVRRAPRRHAAGGVGDAVPRAGVSGRAGRSRRQHRRADEPGHGRGHRPDGAGARAGVRGLRRQDPRGHRRQPESAGRSPTRRTRPC